jgi:isopentenyl-diphosphate Delta-isomerase
MAKVVYVNENDDVIGVGSRDDALKKGIIHRIARVFIFNSRDEMILQKRAEHLPSNPGKWDESAVGYVDAGENYLQSAIRETEEELGITCPPLTEVGKYFSEEPWKDHTRKRFTMLFEGRYDGEIKPYKNEVSETKWASIDALEELMHKDPDAFTFGSKKALKFYKTTTASSSA